jgi:hypothetical protein
MTIRRLRHSADPTGEDEYGNPTYDELDPVVLDGAFVAPRKSEGLDRDGRTGVIVGLTLYAPYGTDLVYTDRVEVDGVVYEIDGEPGRWLHPHTGWQAGVEAALVRGEG